ncbi:MAG: hypothetical protein Q9165_006858 [Trypethelium subeluteriae]
MPGLFSMPSITGASERGRVPVQPSQASASMDPHIPDLNPNATDFLPTPTTGQNSSYGKPVDGAGGDERPSQDALAPKERPLTDREMTAHVKVLADEVIKLRREKTAIEETLRAVSWTVTFRPTFDGTSQEQTLRAPIAISTTSARETSNGSKAGKAKEGLSKDETASQSSEATMTADGENETPRVEDPLDKHADWQPLVIRSLAPVEVSKISHVPDPAKMEAFSFDFLVDMLGGEEYSPGLYYTPPSRRKVKLPTHTWYGLDSRVEPYLPEKPGVHGAKLTPFFNSILEEDDTEGPSDQNVPVFICASKWIDGGHPNLFVYYGSYSQHRWSDKLDYDRMIDEVPNSVKEYWADILTAAGRPEWLTDALVKHFWPAPHYKGVIPSGGSKLSTEIRRNVERYMDDLKSWKTETDMRAGMLKPDNILQAFERPDADIPPGLRLWWEYLKCEGWDKGFYDALVKRKRAIGGN